MDVLLRRVGRLIGNGLIGSLLPVLCMMLLTKPLSGQQIIDISAHDIADLATTVSGAEVAEDFRQTLLRTLSSAEQSYGQDQIQRAIDQLLYFSAEIQLQTPTRISREISEKLGREASNIVRALREGMALGGAEVGPGGATLRVLDADNPERTLELRIPANALSERVFVSLSVDDTGPTHAVMRFPGGGVTLGPEGLALETPATLVLPYPDDNADGVVDGGDFPVRALGVGTRDPLGRIGFLRSTFDVEDRTQSVAIHSLSSYWNVAWRWREPEVLTYKFRWPRPLLARDSGVAVAAGYDLESLKAGVRQGIEVWASALAQAGFRLEEVDENAPAAIRFAFFSPRVPAAAFRTPGGGSLLGPLGPGLGEGIAQVYAYEDPSASGVYFDIAFNNGLEGLATTGLVWTPENKGVPSGLPIELVTLHALGHVLGLGHDPLTEVGQLPVMSARTDLLRPEVCLSRPDVAALRALYTEIPETAPFPPCPHAAVTPSMATLDFGSVETREAVSTQVTLQNVGDGTLVITDVVSEGEFEVDLTETQLTLRAGETTRFGARFAPRNTVGAVEGQILIASNAADSPTAIDLYGSVPQDLPTCTLEATPTEAIAGSPVTLAWTATNLPAEGTIDHGVGSVDPAGGNRIVSPRGPTEYAFSVSNSAGAATCSVMVNVITIPSAEEVWTSQFGTASNDGVWTIFAAASGFFIAGETGGAPGSLGTAFIGHYDVEGEVIWTDRIANARAEGITADASGVYVVGVTDRAMPGQTHLGSWDVFLVKYSSDGTPLWSEQFGTVTRDRAVAVSADASGASIAGITEGALPGQTHLGSGDAFVRKYDPAGVELWTAQFGSTMADFARGVAVGASGTVFVAGDTAGVLPDQTGSGGSDAFLRAYDANGVELWTVQFGEASNDFVEGLALDTVGVYVTGESEELFSEDGAYDVFLRKYDLNGPYLLWTDRFGTPAMGDFAASVAVDSTGVYVGGETYGTFPDQTRVGEVDLFMRRYTSSGEVVWTRQYGSTGSDDSFDVGIDSTGVYLAGSTGGALPGFESAGSLDAFILKIAK